MIEPNLYPEILKCLWERSEIVGDHWLWIGSLNRYGYGSISLTLSDSQRYKSYATHKLSAIIHLGHGEFSEKLVLHKLICKFRNCWNPEHLYLGTQSDNMNDMWKSGIRILP